MPTTPLDRLMFAQGGLCFFCKHPLTAKVELVLANLKQRGHSRPRTLKTLTSTVASLFPKGLPEAELTALIRQLLATGKVVVSDNRVTYEF